MLNITTPGKYRMRNDEVVEVTHFLKDGLFPVRGPLPDGMPCSWTRAGSYGWVGIYEWDIVEGPIND